MISIQVLEVKSSTGVEYFRMHTHTRWVDQKILSRTRLCYSKF